MQSPTKIMRHAVTIATTLVLVTAAFTGTRAEAAEWHFETLDGPGSTWGGPAAVGENSTALDYYGPHTWYIDLTSMDLRHAWWNGWTWSFERLDGSGGTNGRISATVYGPVTSVLYGGHPHVWYTAGTASGDVLRHAWWTGGAWQFETLDGEGGPNGRIIANVEAAAEGIMLYGGRPHVWYQGAGTKLRHAWWTGSTWLFETLDGPGSAWGGTTNAIVTPVTVIPYLGAPHAFYFDFPNKSVRHAWWTGRTWHFEVLDGAGSAYGGTTDQLAKAISSISYYGQPHVFYHNATGGDLRHAWWTGTTWRLEPLDGWVVSPDGSTGNYVGTAIAAGLHAGRPRVWYRDETGKDLRFAWWNGAKWQFVTLDGAGGGNGRTWNDVGFGVSHTLYRGGPHVFYWDATDASLRHAWHG